MNQVSVRRAVAVAAALVVPALAASAAAKKISPRQAEAVAVRKIPGTARSAKWEFEDGHWQYAVLVNARKGGLYEVEISSAGRVTDTEKTSAAEEASEAAADRNAAHGEKGERGEKN